MPPEPKPLVSCIIPVYNGERFISESIASVLAQSYADLELIVADDGSTDGSANIVKSFEHRGVRLIRQANGGAASARNLGIGAACGDFIALLDADDRWAPDKIERQLAAFGCDPELGVCTTHMQNFWQPEYAHEAEVNPQLAKPQPGVASSIVIRKAVVDQVGLFDTSIRHRDIQEWIMRAKHAGWTLKMMPDVLVERRIHGANMSRSRETGESELLDMASKLLARKRAQ